MKMLNKTYQYRAYPTDEQVKQLHYRMWQCRKLWNQALEVKRLVYQMDDYSMTYFDLYARFFKERKGQLDYAVFSARSMSWVLQRLDDAYNAAFKRLKAKQSPGFPKFKGRDDWNNIPQQDPAMKPSPNKKFMMVAFGPKESRLWVKIRYHRPLPDMAELQWAVLTEDKGEWYVNIQLRYPHVTTAHLNPMFAVGLDMGLAHFCTLSTGEYVDIPHIDEDVQQMRRVHRRRSRRGKFVRVAGNTYPAKAKDQTKRWHRVNNHSNKLYRQQKRRRDHFLNWMVAELTGSYQVICIEDISPQFMLHNKHLANKAARLAWSTFLMKLEHKCYEKGVELIKVNPAYSSQTCAECGCIDPDNRPNQETFQCVDCGHKANADANAAQNILQRGLALRDKSNIRVEKVVKHKRLRKKVS